MTSYELTHFKKIVWIWKTKTLLFCLRYDLLIIFRRQNHITFIFIKTMSHDLLVQMPIRPIRVGEVLRRIIGKPISTPLREEIKLAAGPLKVCANHSAGAKVTINAMAQILVMLVQTESCWLTPATSKLLARICLCLSRTEVSQDCSPVEEKRSYPRKGQHRVTLQPCHGMRSTHPLDPEPKSAYAWS